MAGHRKFRDLAAKIEVDPVRVARSEAYERAIKDALKLGGLREHRGATQTAIAGTLGMSQSNVSRIEHEEDIYLSTLARYVDALGGRLELRAIFDDEVIQLTAPQSARDHQVVPRRRLG